MKKPAPIALFVHNRPEHTRRTVEALRDNLLAAESELFIFSDGPRDRADNSRVAEVRQYLNTVSGFKAVSIVESSVNCGLAASIVAGVTRVVKTHGCVVVLEDDLLTSRFFLKFMNDSLSMYEDDGNVASVHGYIYPVRGKLPETFFLRGADCWGWATWKRAWDVFEADGGKLLRELQSRKLGHQFDLSGSYPYMKMLEDRNAGKNQSWAILWHASTFIRDMYTLFPGISLVQNIGGDSSGVHMGRSGMFDVELAGAPVPVSRIEVNEDPDAVQAVAGFLRSLRPGVARQIASRVKRMLFHSPHT